MDKRGNPLLKKIHGNYRAKENVCRFFKECRPGSLLVIHGPSGVGKTALAQTAALAEGVFLHTLGSITKDGVSQHERLLEFMKPRPHYKKEAFLIDPFEEYSRDAAMTSRFCGLFEEKKKGGSKDDGGDGSSEGGGSKKKSKAARSGRAFVAIVNDAFSKGNGYYPLRRMGAGVMNFVRMYALKDREIVQILNDHGMSRSKDIPMVIAANEDGRQAVTFAKRPKSNEFAQGDGAQQV